MLNVPASLKYVLLIRWLNFVFHRCGVTDDLISESFMQDQKFLKYRSLILRCVAACLFLAEDMQPSMIRNHNQNHTVGLLSPVLLILLWRCSYLGTTQMSSIGFNKVELDTLFRIYIQAAEFAKSRLFLHLFTVPSKIFSTYHGRRKLPKARWASSNVRGTIFPLWFR